MATTNFKQWNPTGANIESDATYTADSQRSGGAGSGSIFASALANKLFFQLTVFVTALATALVNKGYSPNDGSASFGSALANLVAVLANIITNADLQNSGSPYAGMLLATQLPADSSHLAATTAFVKNQAYVTGAAANQLVQTGKSASNASTQTVVFGTAYSAAPVVLLTGINTAAPPVGIICLNTISTTGFTIICSDCQGFHWVAVGPK